MQIKPSTPAQRKLLSIAVLCSSVFGAAWILVPAAEASSADCTFHPLTRIVAGPRCGAEGMWCLHCKRPELSRTECAPDVGGGSSCIPSNPPTGLQVAQASSPAGAANVPPRTRQGVHQAGGLPLELPSCSSGSLFDRVAVARAETESPSTTPDGLGSRGTRPSTGEVVTAP